MTVVGVNCLVYSSPRWDICRVWSPVYVSVSPINQTACWLICRTEEDADNLKMIYNILCQGSKKFTLSTYEEYRELQAAAAKGATRAQQGQQEGASATGGDTVGGGFLPSQQAGAGRLASAGA